MLQISEAQMAKADEKARVHFHRRVRDYVRETMPGETNAYPDSKLLSLIAEQDKISGEHEIKTEQGVARWVCLRLWAGEDFYQQPEFKDYFEYPGEPPAEMRLEIYVDHICVLEKDPQAKMETTIKKQGYITGG